MEFVGSKCDVDFQCSWQKCTKNFKRKSDLQRHYRIHTNERPYSCMTPGCGKTFIQGSALTIHIRTHTGEKPYQCGHLGCGKRFSDSSSFARHRRICRKATMQHRLHSHQAAHLPETNESGTSESESVYFPSTPQWQQTTELSHSLIQAGSQLHQTYLLAELNWQQCNGPILEEPYIQATNLPGYAYVPEESNPRVATLTPIHEMTSNSLASSATFIPISQPTLSTCNIMSKPTHLWWGSG